MACVKGELHPHGGDVIASCEPRWASKRNRVGRKFGQLQKFRQAAAKQSRSQG
jgi:hypothetical protein